MWPAKTQISLYITQYGKGSRLSLSDSPEAVGVHAISEDRSDCADAQSDLSLHWSHVLNVGFVVRWPIHTLPQKVNLEDYKFTQYIYLKKGYMNIYKFINKKKYIYI